MASFEFRAIVSCSDDPCSYCRAPRMVRVEQKVYDTYEGAEKHGHAMARNVYGSSVHDVSVEYRTVSNWHDVKSPQSFVAVESER